MPSKRAALKATRLMLLVRPVVCLFADDTGIFQPSQALRTFIEERAASDGSDLGRVWRNCSRCSTRPNTSAAKPLMPAIGLFPLHQRQAV